MLAFALVHMELDGVAVGAVEGFVAIEDDLYVVFAGLYVVEVADGVAEGGVVNRGGLAWLEVVDIEAEDHLGARGERDLHARLIAGVIGEDKEEAAVEWLGAAFFGEGDGEFGRVGRWRGVELWRLKIQRQAESERRDERKSTTEGARARSFDCSPLSGPDAMGKCAPGRKAREAYFVLRD